MDIKLRMEQVADYRAAEEVTREAFWNHFVPGCSEHYLLHIMRDCPAFVRELACVAEWDGKIIGIVVFMKSFIMADNGCRYEVLSMGPIAVLPEYQRKGVGRLLIEHTRRQACKMGFRAVFLCGEPNYYSRVGFVPAEHFGIRTSENAYFAALHACELYEGALSGIRGRYYEHPIYEVDIEAVVEFDREFPARPLVSGTPTQRRFNEVVAMQRKVE